MGTGTGTRMGSVRAEDRRRSARRRTRLVNAMREMGETWVERGKKRRKERVGPVAANPDNLENNSKAGGGGTMYPELE